MCRSLVRAAVDRFGGLDILVNNAALDVPRLDRERDDVAFWDRMMAINLRAPFILMQEALTAMKARGGGIDRQHRIDQRLLRHGHAGPVLGVQGRR